MSKTTSPAPSTVNRRTLLKGLSAATALAAATTTQLPTVSAQEPASSERAMRSSAQSATSARSIPALPSLGVIALNRMGFGPRPGDLAAFQALGGSDTARLQAYVEQQLNPAAIDDSAYEALLATDNFTTLNKSLTQLWADHRTNYLNPPAEFTRGTWTWRLLPAYDLERITFNRALHSRRQLQEVLAEFWFNHFNVYGWDGDIAPTLVSYDRDVIRANMLGNFRDMLEAVAKSTAMLYYLDNRSNSGGTPNENYARELFELHTMGAENYQGVLPQAQVPIDGNDLPVAYVDDDVYGATTCFTGWQVDTATGEFYYESVDHFPNQKVVFGNIIPANQAPLKDGQDVLDMLAEHPGTGRYIARKLCRRFISDDPPTEVVEAAAAVFTAQRNAPDQLTQVVRTILLSDAFKTTWGAKIKRPFEFAVSGLRGIGSDFWLSALPYDAGESDVMNSFLSYYDRAGQALFNWRPPTGYADLKEDWRGTVPMSQRWRMFNWLVTWTDSSSNFYLDLLGLTPSDKRTPNELVDFWTQRILGRTMESVDRQEIVDFMAQGHNPDFDLPLDTDIEVQERLRTLISLIVNTPDFQWR